MRKKPGRRTSDDAIAIAVRREEWELLTHWLLLSALDLVRLRPAGTVDDLVDLLSGEDAPDA